MATNELDNKTGQPAWTERDEKSGVDPLGMQTTSVALYQQLMPGISNVTLRMRYYGFYAWLAHTYANEIGDTSVDRWCQYIRRAEALYALIAQHNGGEVGVAGSRWASKKLAASDGKSVVFHFSTDRDDNEPQYLKQKFGAFGAAYGSQLVEIGLLEYVGEHEIPVPTEAVGDSLALAFGEGIADAGNIFRDAVRAGSVKKKDLERMKAMLPSWIDEAGQERQLYQDILFGEGQLANIDGSPRSDSLRLVLRIAHSMSGWVRAEDIRWGLFASRNNIGEKLTPLPASEDHQKFAWAVYQANDLLHVCYEALLKFALDILGTNASGMPVNQLIEKVVKNIQDAANVSAATWQELVDWIVLADNPWSLKDEFSEFSLLKSVLEGTSSIGITNAECAANALTLLAVLYLRFVSQLPKIAEELPVLSKSAYLQSIVTEFNFILEHANVPLWHLLAIIVRERIIERHLWVATQKFRGQGDYTFLLENDEGRVRVRKKDGPVLTNPRLSSAIRFLEDIHLLDGGGPTEIGLHILEGA